MAAWQCDDGAVEFVAKHFHDCLYSIYDYIGFGLGLLAIVIWVGAQLPQFIDNIKNQSADALSVWFLAQWFLGDTLNLLGCLLQGEQLLTTTATAGYFICADVVMLTQFVYYSALQSRRSAQGHRRRRHHHHSLPAPAPAPAPAPTTPHLNRHHRHHRNHHHHPKHYHHHQQQDGEQACKGHALTLLEPPPPSPSPPPMERTESGCSSKSSSCGNGLSLLDQGQGKHSVQQVHSTRCSHTHHTSTRAWAAWGMLGLLAVACISLGILSTLGWTHRSLQGHPSTESSDHDGGLDLTPFEYVSHNSGIGLQRGEIVLGVLGGLQGEGEGGVGWESDRGAGARWWKNSRSIQQVLGTILGYCSTTMYLMARFSQILKNRERQSAEGLSLAMFCLCVCANLCTGSSMLLRAEDAKQLQAQLPWLAGTFGTVSLDSFIFYQAVTYNRAAEKKMDCAQSPLLAGSENA